MSKTTAQRQAEYRRRHLKDVDGELERLNMLVHVSGKRQLERLAACYGVTQRALLESVLQAEENRAVSGMTNDEQAAYYALRRNDTKAPAQRLKARQDVERVADKVDGKVDAVPAIKRQVSRDEAEDKRAAPIKYKGVYPHKASGKWQAQIRAKGKTKALGLFTTQEQAAAAIETYKQEHPVA